MDLKVPWTLNPTFRCQVQAARMHSASFTAATVLTAVTLGLAVN